VKRWWYGFFYGQFLAQAMEGLFDGTWRLGHLWGAAIVLVIFLILTHLWYERPWVR